MQGVCTPCMALRCLLLLSEASGLVNKVWPSNEDRKQVLGLPVPKSPTPLKVFCARGSACAYTTSSSQPARSATPFRAPACVHAAWCACPRAAAHDARDLRHVAAALAGQDGDLWAQRARRARGHLQRRLAQEAGEHRQSPGLSSPNHMPPEPELLTHPGGHRQCQSPTRKVPMRICG